MSREKPTSPQPPRPSLRLVPDPPQCEGSRRERRNRAASIPVYAYDLFPTDAPAIHFRGRKLLALSSRDVEFHETNPRWYELTLYKGEDNRYYLTIAYHSQTTSEHEQESPRLDVLHTSSLALLANHLARFDFLRPVRLDWTGGGHCCLMDLAEDQHFDLVKAFQLTVTRFLQAIARNRGDYRYRI